MHVAAFNTPKDETWRWRIVNYAGETIAESHERFPSIGTAVAQQHLRSILAFCNSPLMNLIEAYIEFTPNLVTDDGEVTNPSTQKFLADYMKEFHAFIERVYMALPRAAE